MVLEVNGSMRTHSKEKMEARSIDQTMTIVGVRFCRPNKPLRKGYKWAMTQIAKNSLPKSGPHDWYPLFMAKDTPATIPIMFSKMTVVGGMRRDVHLNT